MGAGSNVRERLGQLGVRPTKRLGQNFLLNETIAENIVSACDFPREAHVVEIGPGLGALTGFLLERFPNFTAVEIEHNFCTALRKQYPQLAIKNSNILDLTFSDIALEVFVVSNLPYSISTDVLLKLVYEREIIPKAVILLQREFAERFSAKPGSKQFGSLSVLGQLVFNASLGAVYQGGSFYPPADVESRVLLLERKPDAPDAATIARVEKVLRATFGKRRKQLIGSLSSGLTLERPVVQEALQSIGLKGDERPEDLPVETFLSLSKVLPLGA